MHGPGDPPHRGQSPFTWTTEPFLASPGLMKEMLSRLKNGVSHFRLRPEFVFSLDLLDVAALDHLGEDTLIQKFLDIELADLGIA